MHRAKIVCTLGPATSSPERIRELVEAGMDVARLNMSHGTHADHERSYRLVREAADATGHGVGIIADLQGPKIRLDTFADGPVSLKTGDRFTITTRDVPGDLSICGTTYDGLPGDVRPGDLIVYFKDASHIGMYVGNGAIVHAPRPGRNVTIAGAGSMEILGVVRP